MKDPFQKFKRLYLAEQYDKALYELARLEKEHKLPIDVLIIKGTCIQLGSEKTPYILSDAESAYKKALEIDPENLEALIEAGYYYFVMDNREDIARPYFYKAFSIARKRISEAVRGIAECISETSPKKALRFIESAAKDTVDLRMINKTVADIKKLI
jgi:tetratricopeptide (TPR) repeat protein